MRSRASGAVCFDGFLVLQQMRSADVGEAYRFGSSRTEQSETRHRLWTCCGGSRGSASLPSDVYRWIACQALVSCWQRLRSTGRMLYPCQRRILRPIEQGGGKKASAD
jgi:hypothetical protein